jgi:hypothetical protein
MSFTSLYFNWSVIEPIIEGIWKGAFSFDDFVKKIHQNFPHTRRIQEEKFKKAWEFLDMPSPDEFEYIDHITRISNLPGVEVCVIAHKQKFERVKGYFPSQFRCTLFDFENKDEFFNAMQDETCHGSVWVNRPMFYREKEETRPVLDWLVNFADCFLELSRRKTYRSLAVSLPAKTLAPFGFDIARDNLIERTGTHLQDDSPEGVIASKNKTVLSRFKNKRGEKSCRAEMLSGIEPIHARRTVPRV